MKCRNARKLFSPFMDGELSEEAAQGLRKHLRTCTACTEHHAMWLQLQAELLQTASLDDASQDFAAEVMSRIRAGHSRRPSLGLRLIPAGIYAALFALFVFLGLVVVPGSVFTHQSTSVSPDPTWVNVLEDGGTLTLAQVQESGIAEMWSAVNAAP